YRNSQKIDNMTQMKAIVITKAGGPDVLQLQNRAVPVIGDDEVLIQVKAAGINRPDLFQRKGNYAAPLGVVADIPGLEVSGLVAQIGSAVTSWKVGDKVCCLVAGGGYSEFVTTHTAMCLSIPVVFSFEVSVILLESIYTVCDNLLLRG